MNVDNLSSNFGSMLEYIRINRDIAPTWYLAHILLILLSLLIYLFVYSLYLLLVIYNILCGSSCSINLLGGNMPYFTTFHLDYCIS